ncbi:unnamed protein product [Effrenium voratum]|nr:unnamed protein product [Effrenium voratum]
MLEALTEELLTFFSDAALQLLQHDADAEAYKAKRRKMRKSEDLQEGRCLDTPANALAELQNAGFLCKPHCEKSSDHRVAAASPRADRGDSYFYRCAHSHCGHRTSILHGSSWEGMRLSPLVLAKSLDFVCRQKWLTAVSATDLVANVQDVGHTKARHILDALRMAECQAAKLRQESLLLQGDLEADATGLRSFVTTMKSFVGMGILTLPFATAKGGLILGPLGLVCVAALSHHCMGLLLKLATRTSTRSFGALASNILGRRAKILVDCCLILTQYGFAIADIIFIVENVRDVVCVETAQAACPSRAAVCAGTLICVLPVTWLRSLQVLTVPVLMSNVVLLCGISWVYYCCFVQLGLHGISPNVILFNWAEFPVFFGCAVFSFEGVGLILPIQFAMQQPTQFPKILRRAMFILGSLFASFGMFGYAAYGLDTKDMITFNIPQNKITSFLRLFYCLGIFFTYPVMLFPLYQITEAKIRCLRDQRFCWRRIIFRTTLVIMTGVIGLQIPHFGLFLGIIGSLACSALAFVLPALLHFKRLDRNDASRGGDLKDLSIITFGVYTANWASSFLELLPGEAFACDALFLAIGGLVSFSVTLRDLIHAMVGGE